MVQFNWFTLVLSLGAAQGLFLILILGLKLRTLNAAAKYLICLLAIIVLSLCLRIFYQQELYMQYPHVSEAGDFVLFAFGPVLFLYIKHVLFEDFKIQFPKSLIHFIPLMSFFAAFAYLLTFEKDELIAMQSSGQMNGYYIFLLGTSMVLNGGYLIVSIKETFNYSRVFYSLKSDQNKSQYLQVILFTMLGCLALWAISFCITPFVGWSFYVTSVIYQIAFIGLAVLSYIIAFFAITQPGIFRVRQAETPCLPAGRREKYQHSTLDQDDIEEIRLRLEKSLGKEKLYMDPKLSLNKLALAINTNQVHLSRVINESYNKNFFEVVNEYRIKDFISKVLSEEYSNYTYFGIALESGFNTKATFNKAFKKVTSVTPREFFKNSDKLLKEL